MKSARKWIRDAFGFSSNEINGFLILVPLMMIIAVSEPAYRWWVSGETRNYSKDAQMLDSLVAGWESADKKPPSGLIRFPFDPNTVSEEHMLELGFSETSTNRIAAYRRKGGVFRTKSDLLKIYGLDSTLYKQLYDYIRLPATRLPAPSQAQRGAFAKTWEKRQVRQRFDINTADTLLLKRIYGIGSRLALRIIRFRDALGGFVHKEQLYEVYGLDSVVVERLLEFSFIAEDFEPEKININMADQERLSGHPYISRKLAQRILSYRFQHGDFIDANDIKKLSAIENENLERLLPYVTTTENPN
jgi:competence protein ComEA